MSTPRIPANFNWDFKKNIKMTDEDHLDMLNNDPELGAVILTNQRDNVVQYQNAPTNQIDYFEEFNYIPEQTNISVHIHDNTEEFDNNEELENDSESENSKDTTDLL